MEKSRFVLTVLLFFGQKASGESCTALLDTCTAFLWVGKGNYIISPSKSDKKWCNNNSLVNFCTSYTSFWACVRNTMADCFTDEEVRGQVALFQQVYQFYCTRELLCRTRIIYCLCETSLDSDFNNVTKVCNNQQNFTQCMGEIEDCEDVASLQQAKLVSTVTDVGCTVATFRSSCPKSSQCFSGIKQQPQSALEASLSPRVKETICRILKKALGCMDQMKDSCNVPVNTNVASLKTRAAKACRGTRAPGGSLLFASDSSSRIPTSGLQQLFSLAVVSFLMATFAVVKV
ncbi:uncharacterized protein LOC112559886 isoform X2 [Pomacea canaliculata]|uniref:uncharacterized protein LOC112559886 isoform X2 n=1 Tax=Pomacea canaliculata TaxID=400727 RepID=UPI000D73F597|nr:uncharacterized protein LOC112559886 isoform X2 [Pomacea canaliculata]